MSRTKKTTAVLFAVLFLLPLYGYGTGSAGKEKIVSYVLAEAEQIESTVSRDGVGSFYYCEQLY